MKVFISVDMAGISGLVRWADVVTEGIDFQRNRRLMTQDANAAVAGAFAAGASEVAIEENHGVEGLCDLLIDEIDPRCHVVRGARAPWVETVIVKTALSNQSGDVVPPARARVAIATGAHRAVERAGNHELSLVRTETPHAIVVELREPASDGLRGNLESLPEFTLRDERTVEIVADDMDLGFRRIAYLGYGDRPGLTRY